MSVRQRVIRHTKFMRGRAKETIQKEHGLKGTLGLDVGGTKISAAVLDDTGIVMDHSTVRTAGAGDSVVRQIAELIAAATDQHELLGVGVAVPGDVDPVHGIVRSAPNIGWKDVDLRRALVESVGGQENVVLHNDANAAAWAEYRYGGFRSDRSFAMITVGTGIGGGFVLNGQLLVGASGAAGEVGHLNLIPDGEMCACGARGCWERYASGSALDRLARVAGWNSATASHDVLASSARDPKARSVVSEIARHLVRGVGIVAAALDPSHVVLGGGLGTDPRFVRVVQKAYEEHSIFHPRSRPQLVAASLGPLAGAIGAADLAYGLTGS